MSGYSRYSFSQTQHPPVNFEKKYTDKVLEGNWFNDRQDVEVPFDERLTRFNVRPKEEALQTQDGEVLRPLSKFVLDDSARLFPKDVPPEHQRGYFATMYQEHFQRKGANRAATAKREIVSMDTLEQLYVVRKPSVLPKHLPTEFQRLLDTTYRQTIDLGLATDAALPAAGFGKWGPAPRKQPPVVSAPHDTGVAWAKSQRRFVGGSPAQVVDRPLFKGGSLGKAPFWDATGTAAGAERPAVTAAAAAAPGRHNVTTALTKVHNGVWADEPTANPGYNWAESTTRDRMLTIPGGHAPTLYRHGYDPN